MYEQLCPACVMLNAWPPTVREPLRGSLVFGSTTNATEPAPDPDDPVEIRIHVALDDAVQEQPLLVITVNIPVPPDAGNDPLVGFSVKAQDPA